MIAYIRNGRGIKLVKLNKYYRYTNILSSVFVIISLIFWVAVPHLIRAGHFTERSLSITLAMQTTMLVFDGYTIQDSTDMIKRQSDLIVKWCEFGKQVVNDYKEE